MRIPLVSIFRLPACSRRGLIFACSLLSAHALAAEFHVSAAGDDRNPGGADAPFRTLAAARDAAREFAGKEAVTVWVADGVHYLPETFVLTPQDSGSAAHPVVYRAVNEGKAVLSGGLRLDLKWQPRGGGVFKALTPADLEIDQLFIDGIRQRMARYPNFDPAKTTAAYQGFAADAFSKERAAKWANPKGGYIHAMHVGRWGGYHYRITGTLSDGNVTYEGGWQNNRQMGMHAQFRMVENIFEELDAPGEWFHDATNDTLHFMPEVGVDLSKAAVEVVRLRHLVEFQGSAKQPVRHVTLKGFTFRHAARTFMDTREPLLRSDWAIYRGGAVLLAGTEDVAILDGDFDQVGGNAVFVNHYNRRTLIKGCHIHDAGGSGVCFVGDPAAVRNPLFEYAQTNDISKIDRTPGPKTDNYPADSTVEDCLIHGIGRVERQPAGVQISMSRRIVVRDTTIHDCARAGINISEGTWGGHLIEGCDVFDTVLETHDHGSFNSWGRDRFWSSNHRETAEAEIKKDPKLPYLDVVETNIIRNSRWRCDHGWDIDLDDGSSNYEIYNNLLLAGGLKFREGFGRKAYNNILVNSGFHPHVWFDDSASAFERNIVMKGHAPIGQPQGWAKLVDRNFFTSEANRAAHLGAGGDAHSLAGDPMFVDPASGDFRVADDSPALKISFKNFPMDRFGVKKPSLKAIAKTPVIPEVRIVSGGGGLKAELPLFWLGAPLHGLVGEEFSAFGASKDDGGVQLVKVPSGSAAAMAGLRENDLIQRVNGRKVSGTDDLFAALNAVGAAPLKLLVLRRQKPVEMELASVPFIGTETAKDPGDFRKLGPMPSPAAAYTASGEVGNRALAVLGDGRLAQDYGPVFPNGVRLGAYKLDLGAPKSVAAVNSWSHNQNGNRGRQRVSIYGSSSEADPGWNLADAGKFTPLGSFDTASLSEASFTAASLRAPSGASLGRFRWIVWQTEPVTDLEENTAWQEFSVKAGY
ncbi:MAG: signaling protein [Verrucomicrobia bacterium]|nr:MAG: signaling protein [Verrucomicrobiota bacterium]TAE87401.1 MAG: signaling protein [Verrucomicrobiota bacterium]TAF25256.1 MAG: signaling protein [Verrucomicrobiota bacterium]TAF40901.1 MAG: signaling protein [Verrucomicrobiota bacterium]